MKSGVVGLMLLFAAALAADSQRSTSSHPTFRGGVELIVVRVAVVDADERPIAGLTKDDFVVLENGASQPVLHFLSSDAPIDVALLLDASSSVRPMLRALRTAAATFLQRLRSGDRAMVASFGNRTEILQNLTSDRDRLQHAVDDLHAGGDTRLYDGMYITLRTLSSIQRDVARRQAVVVVSDGRDTASNLRFEDVRRQVIESDVPVYPLLLMDEHPAARHTALTEGLYDITELARESGGHVFRVDNTTSLKDAYMSVTRELSNQYVLAYAAGSDTSEAVRTNVEVRIPSHPEAEARAHVDYTNRTRDAPAAIGRTRRGNVRVR